MKIIKYICAVVCLIIVLPLICHAEDEPNMNKDLLDDYTEDIFGSLDDNTQRILSQMGIESLDTERVFDLDLKDMVSVLKTESMLQIKENLSQFYKILAAVLVILLFNTIRSKNDNDLIDDVLSIIIIIFISSLITDSVKLLACVLTLTKGFLICITPIMTVLLSLSGNITFSALYSAMMIGFCQVLAIIADNILIPFTGIYFALIIAMNFNEVTDAEKICSTVNNGACTVLGTVSTLFTLLLSAKNILAKDIDGILFTSGKYLISSFIPVVGGAVSGILSSVIGSLSIVKSTVGIFAVIAAVCINLPLFIKIILCRGAFWILSFICDTFGESRITGTIKSLSKSLRFISVLAFFELITVLISTGLAVSIRGNI